VSDYEYEMQFYEKAIEEGLRSFVGAPASHDIANDIKQTMEKTLKDNWILPNVPIPEVKIEINGPQVTARFFDPVTREEVYLTDLMGVL
jgi:hypothetical protein